MEETLPLRDNPLKDKLVLVVDDEPRLVNFVRLNLEVEGCRVTQASDGLEALEKVRQELPELVILDVALPKMDGFEALAEIRKFSEVPVIMLTVRAQEDERVRGLELGADDYIAKPFSPRELVSRAKAVLRRMRLAGHRGQGPLKVDDRLQIDFERRRVVVDGKPVKLRPTEWRLLYHLVNNAGRVMTHDMLLAKVWGHEYLGSDHYVRLYVTYLRQKIEEEPSNPRYILTERGMGYRFREL